MKEQTSEMMRDVKVEGDHIRDIAINELWRKLKTTWKKRHNFVN